MTAARMGSSLNDQTDLSGDKCEMSIEFQCPDCDMTLSVGDEFAGQQCRCPSCDAVVPVPLESEATENDADPRATSPLQAGSNHATPSRKASSGKSQSGSKKAGAITNRAVTFGEVFRDGLELWKANVGLVIAVFIVVAAVNCSTMFAFSGVARLIVALGGDGIAVLISNLLHFFGQLVTMCVSVFIGIGQMQIYLTIARGRQAEFGDLFGGGSRFVPTLGIAVIFGLISSLGMFLCILPGIIFALLWWPCYYLVVDNKASVFGSFSMAREITRNNLLTTILLVFTSIGLTMLGFLACCVGWVLTIPLVQLMWIVAYLKMSSQIDQ